MCVCVCVCVNMYTYDYITTACHDEMYKEPEQEIKSTGSGEYKLNSVTGFKQVSLYFLNPSSETGSSHQQEQDESFV